MLIYNSSEGDNNSTSDSNSSTSESLNITDPRNESIEIIDDYESINETVTSIVNITINTTNVFIKSYELYSIVNDYIPINISDEV